MKAMKKTRFKCVVCGKITAGRAPKWGNGRSANTFFRYPRRHKVNGKDCPGNIQEAELVEEPAPHPLPKDYTETQNVRFGPISCSIVTPTPMPKVLLKIKDMW